MGRLKVPEAISEFVQNPRFEKWVLFGAGAALLPVIFDLIAQLSGHTGLNFAGLFPASGTYLVGIGITMNSLGEMVVLRGKAKAGLARRWTGYLCFVTLLFGIGLYGFNKPDIYARPGPALVYLGVALVTSFMAVVVCRNDHD